MRQLTKPAGNMRRDMRSAPGAAAQEATEQLGESAEFLVRGHVEPLKDAVCFHPQSVASQTKRYDAVVVRPNRAVMVRHRIIPSFSVASVRTPELLKTVWTHQSLRDQASSLTTGYPGKKGMACIRRPNAQGRSRLSRARA